MVPSIANGRADSGPSLIAELLLAMLQLGIVQEDFFTIDYAGITYSTLKDRRGN